MADEYKLAIGWNNTAGYVVIKDVIVSTKQFAHVQGMGKYSPGEKRNYIDGAIDFVGEKMFTWLITRLHIVQYTYLVGTINAGRQANKVTARTRFNDATYYNTNAWMEVPETINLSRSFNYYLDVELRFTGAVVI